VPGLPSPPGAPSPPFLPGDPDGAVPWVPGPVEGPRKLGMERRRLSTQHLILLGVAGKQRRDGRRHLSTGGGHHRAVVGAAAASVAARTDEPMPAISEAAPTSMSGTASTYDIAALPSGHTWTVGHMNRAISMKNPWRNY
jgi:hypothetical protein